MDSSQCEEPTENQEPTENEEPTDNEEPIDNEEGLDSEEDEEELDEIEQDDHDAGTSSVYETETECQKQNTWYSQPLMPGYRIPAGNFLLCLCILLTGGSATKVIQMFRHMGLGCVSLNTFFKYQRVCILLQV